MEGSITGAIARDVPFLAKLKGILRPDGSFDFGEPPDRRFTEARPATPALQITYTPAANAGEQSEAASAAKVDCQTES